MASSASRLAARLSSGDSPGREETLLLPGTSSSASALGRFGRTTGVRDFLPESTSRSGGFNSNPASPSRDTAPSAATTTGGFSCRRPTACLMSSGTLAWVCASRSRPVRRVSFHTSTGIRLRGRTLVLQPAAVQRERFERFPVPGRTNPLAAGFNRIPQLVQRVLVLPPAHPERSSEP